METLNNFFTWLNGYLWGPPLLILLFGTHLFMTVRTGFIQKKIGLAIRLSITKDADGKGDVSQFGALTTALASTIGTGNIVGVGTAIALGGPGAVLWMWLTGVFGIATKYAESLVAVKYRVQTSDGTMLGGAMYALERGLKMKWLGVLFALFAALTAFGIGATVQANAVSKVVLKNFDIPLWVSGAIMAVLVAVVILGGVKSITKTCEKLVPFMAVFYVIGCIIILVMNRNYIWDAVVLICTAAFTPSAAGGGFIGASIMMAARFGVARGLFSNESGMGSAPIVAAAAQTRNPVRQALVSATGTFWDTVVICAMTGLVLVSTVISNPAVSADGAGGAADGALLTSHAFNQIPVIGPIVLTFGLITFAFSTILGWSYYGERGAEYLFGKAAIIPYKAIYVIITFIGAVMSLSTVWNIADALNMLMAIPNLICILLLSGVIAKDTKYYLTGNNIDKIDDTPIPFIQNKNKK
ncbi:alanine/glycine:cation symporter family protein [Sinanaerobacter chloroacetimidivorans]|jgi:AGCS family alanine or glycine:cation symporter|uniref:Alanine:cation symporter family protein n=1 Tax=Sinanaerobacter chloroacetimidivorans TaxID=2818044 RepID=A0A8J7W226_9FIRM|nr:alanine/glycine:cation symporter family protein [Sinanaerobacter chloroacetimidivorans]MBR0597470.1 alanine:cation symporter family protein [Sinanaerobacter chloroacetimidivorans]